MKNRHLHFGIAVAMVVISPHIVSCSGDKNPKDGRDDCTTINVAFPEVDSVVIYKSYPGYLGADQSIEIVARVNGYLVDKRFGDGDIVKPGDVLFKIEDTQYRDQLQQAQAQLATAIATEEYATRHYNAMKKALASDAVSQMDVIQSESAMNEAVAAVSSAKAAVSTARTMLGYCTVTSPIEGRAAAPAFSVGEYLSGGGSPVRLTTVYDDRKVKANIAVEDARYLEIISNLRNRKVNYDSIPVIFNDSINGVFYGRLCYVAPNIVTNTGTIDIQVEIQNPTGVLKDGMYAIVNMPVASDPHAVLVKDASIGTDQLGKFLYIVNDSDKVEYHTVQTGGHVNDSMRIVTEGIKPGQRYVTKALLKVRSGMTVCPDTVR